MRPVASVPDAFATCVKSGPIVPLAEVPATVWQFAQVSCCRNSWAPHAMQRRQGEVQRVHLGKLTFCPTQKSASGCAMYQNTHPGVLGSATFGTGS